jgi:hypothetical protein
MDIRSSSSLRRKNSEDKILLVQSFRALNEIIIELKSNIHHNSITTSRLDHPCLSHLVLEGKDNNKGLIKTGRDIPVIKATSQKHNYPRLDHPCPSVLIQLLQRDGRKLTYIKQKVSNTYT